MIHNTYCIGEADALLVTKLQLVGHTKTVQRSLKVGVQQDDVHRSLRLHRMLWTFASHALNILPVMFRCVLVLYHKDNQIGPIHAGESAPQM